jgi:hypothetical protein
MPTSWTSTRCSPELTAYALWGLQLVQPGRNRLHRARCALADPYVGSFGGRLRSQLLAVEASTAWRRPKCWSRTGGSSTTPPDPTAPLATQPRSTTPGPAHAALQPAGFRSTFAPPDARPRGTERNGRGRRVTTRAGARPFAHVTGNGRDQVGMGGHPQGASGATCKIAGIAFTGSNPVPATLPLTCENAVAASPVTPARRVGFPSGFPPLDRLPTPLACSGRGPEKGASITAVSLVWPYTSFRSQLGAQPGRLERGCSGAGRSSGWSGRWSGAKERADGQGGSRRGTWTTPRRGHGPPRAASWDAGGRGVRAR